MLTDLEPKAAAGQAFSRQEAERVLGCADLVAVGVLGETARRARHGDAVTYVQVLPVSSGVPADLGEAREVRLLGRPDSVEAAAAWVRDVVAAVGGVPVTGFDAGDLFTLAGGDHLALAEAAARLREAGLSAVAALAIDRVTEPAELVRALTSGGLAVPRAIVHEAVTLGARLAAIEAVAALQADTGALQAFAPLPVVDQAETPSTGYDDVRTVAVARLVCAAVPSIQVDWATYGPKLAQVALAYGANDLDAVPAFDTLALGQRRSPRAEIERQIAAAFATPVARNGRFEPV